MRDDAKACDALVRSADVAAMSSDARDRSSSSVLGSWRSEFSSSNAYRTRLRKGRFFSNSGFGQEKNCQSYIAGFFPSSESVGHGG